MEALNLLLKKGLELRLWDGIPSRPNGLIVSHLQYADDTLIFCPPNIEYLSNIKKTLIAFHLASGLAVNFHKSAIYGINVEDSWLNHAAGTLLCRTGTLPFSYLGLPIRDKPSKLGTWDTIICRMSNKLASWKGKLLSIGGRLTLIKASLSNLPLYYMSLLPISKGVIEKLVTIQRNFLWSGSDDKRALPLVAWANIELPKMYGGLGIGNLLHKNIKLLLNGYGGTLMNPRLFGDLLFVTNTDTPHTSPSRICLSPHWEVHVDQYAA